MTLSIAEQARRSRDLAAAAAAEDERKNAKHPIYNFNHQQQVLNRIKETLNPLYEVYFKLALETGERTNDLCHVKYSDFTFNDDGSAVMNIIVSKQTKSAEKRAINKVYREWKDNILKIAGMTGDNQKFMLINNMELPEIENHIPEESIEAFREQIFKAVNGAAIKRSSKKVSRGLVTLIKAQQERNIFDDFLFSSRMMSKSNRTAASEDQCISRKTIWLKFKAIFAWFELKAKTGLKLSAYSLRKTFAINKFNDAKKKGEDATAAVCELFGHSTREMTRKYLMLDLKIDEPISI